MDFRVVDNLVSLNSATAASNNGGSLASETDADASTLRLYGSAFLSRECAAAEDDDGLPAAKAAKISSCGGEMAKVSSQEWSNGGGLTPPHQQMLSFYAHHAPPLAFPSVRTSSGYGCGVRGPFTPSQWMELEHQALIYKYITANVPIPSSLLIPIRKAFESSGFSCFSLLRSNALGWGGFHMGFSKNDPEPGRCRRTDGKKWRCSRDAVTDQKYCERHINRGRHRSRKPVEGGTTATSSNTNASSPASLSLHHQQTNNLTSGNSCPTEKEHAAAPKMCFKESVFGSVASDSLLNPFTRSPSHALRHFIDEWPKGHSDLSSCAASPTNEKLADRDFEATQMGLGVGAVASEQSQRHSSWDPISWEPSVGGPLGEALHSKALDLMETSLPSSPLGVHRGAFVGVALEQRAARRSTGIAFATASSAPVSCFHHYLHSES